MSESAEQPGGAPPASGQPGGRPSGGEHWERDVLERLAFASLREQRRARRWGIFFKLLGFVYLTLFLILAIDWRSVTGGLSAGEHTALVDIVGVIGAQNEASAERINAALDSAFDDKNTKGVIVRINSPGGSPVQAGLIYDEIRRLRGLHPNIPLYAVVEDVCASGGYYIAAAADKIYVDKASIVGSIGVIMEGWGFTGAIEKLGIERRVLVSGRNKAFLDPFLPVDEKQREHAQEMLDEVHQQFIERVKQGRGKRLKETPDLFSGLIWTGAKSVELGLADGFGSVDYVARAIIKAENIVDYTPKENVAERLARRFGAGVASELYSLLARSQLGLH